MYSVHRQTFSGHLSYFEETRFCQLFPQSSPLIKGCVDFSESAYGNDLPAERLRRVVFSCDGMLHMQFKLRKCAEKNLFDWMCPDYDHLSDLGCPNSLGIAHVELSCTWP